MTVIALTRFSGEIPKAPPHLIPPGNAQSSVDCDFSHGELRAIKAPFDLMTVTNTVKALYTPDGLRYFTWPVDADAVKAPTLDDIHDRVYYTTPTDFRVTKSAYAKTSGGEPQYSYRAGVPQPTAAPALTSGTTTSCDGTASKTATFWYEYAGKKYQEAVIALYQVVACSKFTFATPAKTLGVDAVVSTAVATSWTDSANWSDAALIISDPVETVISPAVAGTPDLAMPMLLIEWFDAGGEVVMSATPTGSQIKTGGQYATSLSGTTTMTATLTANRDYVETRAYVFTLVNNYDEESAPSPATIIDVEFRQPVTITMTTPSVDQYVPLKYARVYRSNTGSSGAADYQYVADFQAAVGVDNVPSSRLNEVLTSHEYLPPSPSLQGLCYLGNGILAAFKGNEVQFSEAYRGAAWPPSYALNFPHNIVSIIPLGSGLLATTTAHPYLISGVTPDAMSQMRLPAIQAGVNKRAIADTGNGIVYASHDGLVTVHGTSVGIEASQRFFTREDWRDRYGTRLSSLTLAAHDGALIGFFPDADGFIIRLDEEAGTLTKYTGRHSASFVLPQTDSIYVASGSTISQYAGGANKTLTWHSGEYVMPKPVNFGALYFDGAGVFTISIYCDGVLKHEQSLTALGIHRLPSGFMARKWSFKLVGTGTVRALHVAESMRELAHV